MFSLKKSLKGINDKIDNANGKNNNNDNNKRDNNIFYILYNSMAEIFSNNIFFDRYCTYHTNTRKVDVYYSNTSWYDERKNLLSKQLRYFYIFDFWYEKKMLPSYFNSY